MVMRARFVLVLALLAAGVTLAHGDTRQNAERLLADVLHKHRDNTAFYFLPRPAENLLDPDYPQLLDTQNLWIVYRGQEEVLAMESSAYTWHFRRNIILRDAAYSMASGPFLGEYPALSASQVTRLKQMMRPCDTTYNSPYGGFSETYFQFSGSIAQCVDAYLAAVAYFTVKSTDGVPSQPQVSKLSDARFAELLGCALVFDLFAEQRDFADDPLWNNIAQKLFMLAYERGGELGGSDAEILEMASMARRYLLAELAPGQMPDPKKCTDLVDREMAGMTTPEGTGAAGATQKPAPAETAAPPSQPQVSAVKPDFNFAPFTLTNRFDSMQCGFRMLRRVPGSGDGELLAQGTFIVRGAFLSLIAGEWLTGGDKQALALANLAFVDGDRIAGALEVFPLFNSGKNPPGPSFVARLDGVPASLGIVFPIGKVDFSVDADKIDIRMVFENCSI